MKAEKEGRKGRRKRTKPILSEEEVNQLKRKPTTPVKPSVSKKRVKLPILWDNVTDVVVLDSGQTPLKEEEENKTGIG